MYFVTINDDKFIQIIKTIKLGKNLGRDEKTHLGILTLFFQLQPRNSEAREPISRLDQHNLSNTAFD